MDTVHFITPYISPVILRGSGGFLWRKDNMKIGERFFHDNFGTKLEYEVDSVNENGTFNAHLVKVHGIEYATEIDAIESVSDMADTPVEEAKEDKPKTTTADKANAPKRAYHRKPTTTKK